VGDPLLYLPSKLLTVNIFRDETARDMGGLSYLGRQQLLRMP
jgi:hypothetical protein